MFTVNAGPDGTPELETDVAPATNAYAGSVLGQYSDEHRREILSMLHRDLGWDKEDEAMDAEETAR